MPPIEAIVSWPATSPVPVVHPDPIPVLKGSGATVIQWTCGNGVATFKISGLDPAVFTPSASKDFANNFSTTDANRVPQMCTYEVSAVRTTGGTVAHDPRIENGGK
jgi:hypothetical protein